MGKITRALMKYNHVPNTGERTIYDRMNDFDEDRSKLDEPDESPFNVLSAVVVVLVVTVLSMLSLNTLFFLHKGQKRNAQLAQSVFTQQKQLEQLTDILGDRQESMALMQDLKRTQSAFGERDAEWQEFAKNQYSSGLFMERLQEDQNVMLEKMIQMSHAIKDMEDILSTKKGKEEWEK